MLCLLALFSCSNIQKTKTNELVESLNKEFKILKNGKPNGKGCMFYSDTLKINNALIIEENVKNRIDKVLQSLPIKSVSMTIIDGNPTSYDVWETPNVKVEFSKIYFNEKNIEIFELITTEK